MSFNLDKRLMQLTLTQGTPYYIASSTICLLDLIKKD